MTQQRAAGVNPAVFVFAAPKGRPPCVSTNTSDRPVSALATRPAEILGLEVGRLAPGAPADLILVDPDAPWVLDADALRSKSKNTPFEGARFSGLVRRTLVAGRTVFEAGG